MMRKQVIGLLLVGVTVVGGWSYFSSTNSRAGKSVAAKRELPAVRVESIELESIKSLLPLVGKLQARQSIVITPEVSGRIVALPVEIGGEVPAGAKLVQLDEAKQQASLAESEAYLRNEQRKLRDMTRLASRGVTTQNDLDSQISAVAQAQARRDMAAFELSQRRLLAPFAGQVGLYDVSLGALVNPGETLLHLDDLSSMRLDLAVPERYMARLKPGATLTGHSVAWGDKTFTGKIEAIDSRVDSDSLNIKVRVQFANAGRLLRPGMLMQVDLPFTSDKLPLIPAQAIEFQGNNRFVYLLNGENKVRRQQIRVGESQDSRVSVQSGLKAGDKLVVEGLVSLKDGQKVKLITEPSGVAVAGARP